MLPVERSFLKASNGQKYTSLRGSTPRSKFKTTTLLLKRRSLDQTAEVTAARSVSISCSGGLDTSVAYRAWHSLG